jgi:UDP-2,3-diacylglucosamine pyrophosphatase LpxH
MRYKTIVMSDVHLGSKASRAKDALKFLEENTCDRLILNGDVIDMWAIRRGGKWKDSHSRFIKRVLKIAKKREVIYVIGNHDDFLEDFLPLQLPNIHVVKDYVMTDAQGKRLYVFHGDVLDVFIRKMKWLAVAGSIGYDIALWMNRVYNIYREWRGLPYYSISRDIKNRVKSAVDFINDFEDNSRKLAQTKCCDIAVCGHIHQPDLQEGYMNSGDWCENCTALVERLDGGWEIYYYHNVKNGTRA